MTEKTTEFTTETHNIGGVETAVLSAGSGKPILFLHGASTLEGFDVGLGLADRFKVIVPCHPGMGLSGPAPHISGMQDMVLHYLNLIDTLGLEKPHLIGFSMGGWMATELAAVAGDRFDKLVLVAPAGLADPENPMTPLSDIAPEDLPGYLAHDASVALRYFPGGELAPPAEEFVADRTREGETVNRILAPFGMGHPNLDRFITRISNPTLLVWGEDDRMIPSGQAKTWSKLIKQSQTRIVPDAGHFVLLEKPATVAEIGDFLAGS
jgi:pimeloyl-ACP methyl ester carboxylesterase